MGWFELEASGDGRKFVIAAEIAGPGIRPSVMRNAIVETAGNYFATEIDCSREIILGDLRPIEGRPEESFEEPLVHRDEPQIRVWKVTER